MTTVVCQQLAPLLGDLDANRDLALQAIADAVRSGADIVVLPELVTCGYSFESKQEAQAAAIPADHSLFDDFVAAAARGPAVVVAGFAELGEDGLLYNSAAVVDGSGLLGVYRKAQLWDGEKRFFTPGAAPPRVFDTAAGRIGVLVCYDLEFPELTRLLALEGAELLAVPTNWPLLPRPEDERPPEVLVAQASARVNRVAVACCDRSGTERGQEWTGGTAIVNSSGWVVATQSGIGQARAELDLAQSRDKRIAADADALGDRRPELYGRLSDPSNGPP